MYVNSTGVSDSNHIYSKYNVSDQIQWILDVLLRADVNVSNAMRTSFKLRMNWQKIQQIEQWYHDTRNDHFSTT